VPSLDPATIEARTPPDRDRVVDLVRLVAIVLVVVGHWLVAVVLVGDGGELVTGRLLDVVPATQPLTYLFQVMPLFFLVGGAVNLGSYRRAVRDDTPAAVWIRRRARRLLVPTLPLLALWVPLAPLLGRLGVPEDEVALATTTAFLPVWFLAVYLLTVALTPVTSRAHDRWGVRVVAAAIVATGVVDLAHLAEVPVVGFANYLLVWAGAHQLGYLWADDRLPSHRGVALALALGGVAAIVLLVTLAGYPLSVVASETGERNNTDPPTLVLWALTVAQLGVVLAARPTLWRWLRRPRLWAVVVRGGSVLITVFLWHMTALVVAAALTHPTGLWPTTDQVDLAWWAWRPVWLALCALVLAPLIVVFRRLEQPADPVPRPGRLRAATGTVATVTGLALVLTGGLYTPEAATALPVGPLGLILVGFAALGALRPGGGQEEEDRPPGSGTTPSRSARS
jgi:fucose 4-O-acetylase-like acetyltransferase